MSQLIVWRRDRLKFSELRKTLQTPLPTRRLGSSGHRRVGRAEREGDLSHDFGVTSSEEEDSRRPGPSGLRAEPRTRLSPLPAALAVRTSRVTTRLTSPTRPGPLGSGRFDLPREGPESRGLASATGLRGCDVRYTVPCGFTHRACGRVERDELCFRGTPRFAKEPHRPRHVKLRFQFSNLVEFQPPTSPATVP